jgi:hypothetical protein
MKGFKEAEERQVISEEIAERERSERTAKASRPEDTASGNAEVHLFDLPAGSRATRAEVRITGGTFYGKLKLLQGAKVSASPVIYSNDGVQTGPTTAEQAYIVDFGGSRSVLELEMLGSGAGISLVLPWLGMDFSPRASYPAPSGGGTPVPIPDGDASSYLGLTGVETAKLFIQLKGSGLPTAEQFGDRCRITTGTYPTNVKASLNGRLPFWTKPGPLQDAAEPTGLVEDLNALLSGAQGTISVQLAVSSDTPGVLTVDFDAAKDADVDQVATARWGGQASTQVALAALEPMVVAIPFPTEDASGWEVSEMDLDLTGVFPPWRASPQQTTTSPGKLGLRVDAEFAVARRFELEEAGLVFGVALLLRPPGGDAQLHVELVPEAAGAPGAGKPLVGADLTVPASAAVASLGGSAPFPVWQEVKFGSPVSITALTGVWVVVKAKTGSIEWLGAVEPASAATRTLVAGGGGRWDHYPQVDGGAPVAQIRLLRAPFARENAPLLQISWADGEGEGAQAEPAEETVTVSIGRPDGKPFVAPVDGGSALVDMMITAGAAGTLTLKRATAAYREAEA